MGLLKVMGRPEAGRLLCPMAASLPLSIAAPPLAPAPQALVHSWLCLKGHPVGACRLAEAWTTAMRVALQQEVAAAAAAAAATAAPGAAADGGEGGEQQQPEEQQQQEEQRQEEQQQTQEQPQEPSKAQLPPAGPGKKKKGRAREDAQPLAGQPVALVSDCQRADMAAFTPSELLGMAAWAAACPRGDKTLHALAAAAAAAAEAPPPGGGRSRGTSLARGGGAAGSAGPSPATTGAGNLGPAAWRVTADTVAHVQLPALLAALREVLLTGSVDSTWTQATYPHWRESLRGVMAEAQVRRLEAEAAEAEGGGEGGEGAGGDEADGGGGGAAAAAAAAADDSDGEGADTGGVDPFAAAAGPPARVSQAAVEALLSAAAGWCISNRCVTTGTMSLLRQVRRARGRPEHLQSLALPAASVAATAWPALRLASRPRSLPPTLLTPPLCRPRPASSPAPSQRSSASAWRPRCRRCWRPSSTAPSTSQRSISPMWVAAGGIEAMRVAGGVRMRE
jgi:hypothetical protein